MVFRRNLRDGKFPQVSRTLHSILTNFNNAVVWMVSTRPLISMSSSPCINPSVIVSRAHITIDITITLMLQFFLKFLATSTYLSFFSFFFSILLCSTGTVKSTMWNILFFAVRSGRLAETRWSVCVSKSHRVLCVSFSRTDSGLCVYHLFVWSNLNFSHNSQWISLPTQLCLVLYSFGANLLHSLLMWLIVFSLSLPTFTILLCHTYSCFYMICPYGIVLSCY